VREFVAAYGIEIADDAGTDAWFADYSSLHEKSWIAHEDAIPGIETLTTPPPDRHHHQR
jgi:hypothetical protein